MGINKKDKIEEIIGYLMNKGKSLKKNLKDEKEESYVYFEGWSNYKIRVNACSTKNNSEISLDFFIESAVRPDDWKCERYTVKLDEDYKVICDILYEKLSKSQSSQSASGETQSADAESNVKKDCKNVLNSEKACDKYNYEPYDEQFPACFDGNVKLGIVNNDFVEIQKVASFADWSDDFRNNLNKIEGNTILLGLNISSSIGKPWENFHSKSNEDERLKYACEGVFDRAYITDLIKDFPNGKSSEAMNAFKNNDTLRYASVEMFVREIAFLIHCGLIEKNKPLHTVLLGSAVQECMKCKIAQKKIKDIICDEINNLGCKKIIFGKAYHYSFRKCSMSDDQANKGYREQFKRLKEKMPHAGNGEVVDNPHCFLKK